jgi:hypothetical protein
VAGGRWLAAVTNGRWQLEGGRVAG